MPNDSRNLPFLKPGGSFVTDPISRLTLFLKRTPAIQQLECPLYTERVNPTWRFIVNGVPCEVERSDKRFYLRTGRKLLLDSTYTRGQSGRLESNILAL